MIDAYGKGDVAHAASLHRGLLPVYTGTFRTQGVILTKATLRLLGHPAGPVRLPLVDATDKQVARLVEDLQAGGVTL
jgi:4-hydroxy-tetrahydrodipicolinate synthase